MDVSIESELLQDNFPLRNWIEHSRESQKQQSSAWIASSLGWDATAFARLKHELKCRGYSPKTIRAYCGQVDRYYRFLLQKGLQPVEASIPSPKRKRNCRMF